MSYIGFVACGWPESLRLVKCLCVTEWPGAQDPDPSSLRTGSLLGPKLVYPIRTGFNKTRAVVNKPNIRAITKGETSDIVSWMQSHHDVAFFPQATVARRTETVNLLYRSHYVDQYMETLMESGFKTFLP
eukprot:5499801-Amphidinium_carterae.2